MNTQTYTDTQLKQALAKVLPEHISYHDEGLSEQDNPQLYWICNAETGERVLDTELLHLCWLVEHSFSEKDYHEFTCILALLVGRDYTSIMVDKFITNKLRFYSTIHATWQQRTIALCKVKGIEI